MVCRSFLFTALLLSFSVAAQTVAQKLESATKALLNSAAGRSANFSLYVAEEDGRPVYSYQAERGLSTASTQKIFTAAAALETLGKDFRYSTTLSHTGTLSGGVLNGDLILRSNGDPTLGSWRYDGYKPEQFKDKIITALKAAGLSKISGDLIIDDSYYDFQSTPGGWPWNDMGNYYGAGIWAVNWRENQFDLQMKGSQMGRTNVDLPGVKWKNEVQTGGSSDQSIIYTAPFSDVALIAGTLPAKNMTVSGAMPNPPLALATEMQSWLSSAGINLSGKITTAALLDLNGAPYKKSQEKILLEIASPTLEQIVFWFMRKSVNLYGEALVKTLALEKKKDSRYSAGIAYLKVFWKSKGIEGTMINFADGSGLSPQNYVSARAEVQALLWSKKRPWFKEFYDGFPVQSNGMKMKSGTMKDTKSFCGFHTAKNGKTYVFAAILNNYQSSNLSDALFSVLNNLK